MDDVQGCLRHHSEGEEEEGGRDLPDHTHSVCPPQAYCLSLRTASGTCAALRESPFCVPSVCAYASEI